ncbi:MAG: hypothetical protein LBE20_02375 [Deltaproteobacteria bacterium]|jgi:flagellar biosynthesis/type III secretory pathway protein FliH|nr:hypothetical protein [Deltaproteobacteria bacterium]
MDKMPDTFKSTISQSKEILESARKEAQKIIEEARQVASQEAKQTQDDAFQKGYAEALLIFSEIKQEKDRILEDLAKRAWDAVLNIAKQITGELIDKDYQTFILQRLTQALEIFSIQNKITLTMNNQDYQLLLGKLNRDGLKLQVNNSLTVGTFEISSDGCKLVASIDKQLETIIKNYAL